MLLLRALLLVALCALPPMLLAAPVLDSCRWGSSAEGRGVNRFMLDVPSAVDNYRDIPAEARERLKARMRAQQYDDIVAVRPGSVIESERFVYRGITDMHFGMGLRCRNVRWDHWSPTDPGELGLAYHDVQSGHTIVVFTVCRNVSRTVRVGPRTRSLAELTPISLSDVPGGWALVPPVALDLVVPPLDDVPQQHALAVVPFGSSLEMDTTPGVDSADGGRWAPVAWPGIGVSTAAAAPGLPETVAPIPEPSTLALLLLGLVLVAWAAVRGRR